MRLRDSIMLFLDCQTTGMRPSVGSLMEMAWAWGSVARPEDFRLESRLLCLPEGHSIPSRVTEMTGLADGDLVGGITPRQLQKDFIESIPDSEHEPVVLIHYAQFEKAWLEDLFAPLGGWPCEVFCSQQIARRLFPQLPSQNIRALAGYLGHRTGEIKRATAHTLATAEIWKGLVDELEKREVHTFEELRAFMKGSKKPKVEKYEYRIDRLKRLALPPCPGVYRMLAKNGDVLYVGKATSLKDRVNSYFRGKKGRDTRKLEMLAQVWDLEVTECGSILEASLLESDEIKRLDPPYNISLKSGRRKMVFYTRDFESSSAKQTHLHRLGPFRTFGSLEQLRWIQRSVADGRFRDIFFRETPPDDLAEGFRLFCAAENVTPETFSNLRSALALGIRLLRRQLRSPTITEEEILAMGEEEPERDSDAALTPEEIVGKFERLCARAAADLRKSRKLTRLLNARVTYRAGDNWRILEFRRGSRYAEPGPAVAHPWQDLEIADFDRMSVLLSEISRTEHRIEILRPDPEDEPVLVPLRENHP